MVSLTNPIENSNIISRFKDYVEANANAETVWASNVRPSYDGHTFSTGHFAGNKGQSATVSEVDTGVIDYAGVYNTCVDQTRRFTNIRKMRARLNKTGGGGNRESGPGGTSPGIIYDSTQVARLHPNYTQSFSHSGRTPGSAGSVIDDGAMENFFYDLRERWKAYRNNAATIQEDVCHASCHASCHGSRGRR